MQMNDTATQSVSPGQLAWLTSEIRTWQADGLVGETEATAILDRYRAVAESRRHRLSLARLALALGGGFVGIGLIWLVAANIDQLPPMVRFLVVSALWLGVTAAAEWLAGRREHRDGSPVVGAFRGLSPLLFGAVIFQAAQSLQVPAYEPSLVGGWAIGALLYAYAVHGVAPLVVGLATGVGWIGWQLAESTDSALGVVLALLLAGAVAASIAVLHQAYGLRFFVVPWRVASTLLTLVGLFVAAMPFVNTEDFAWGWQLTAGIAVAVLVAGAAALSTSETARFEPLAALGVVLAAGLLVWWDPGEPPEGGASLEDWAHAAASVVVYVAAAAWVAALGILRESAGLTYLAMAALIVFTTVQAFAVFAAVIQGAWLFVVLGLIFLGSGYLFDRARRELTSTLEEVAS